MSQLFPPKNWLGFSLDMTTVTPSDITTVAGSVLRFNRLIKLNPGGTQQTVNGITWTVPDGVDLAGDISQGSSSFTTYADGATAASDLEADASISAKYLAVAASASTNYAISKTFHSSYQYALFNYNETMLQIGLADFSSAINETVIKGRLEQLATFDSSKNDIVADYKKLFKTLGTHVITGASYGGRFQLNVWASNIDSSVKDKFSADISVAFNGLTSSGNVDASIKTTSQYSTFKNTMQRTCSCIGGDVTLASKIASDPTGDLVFKMYQSWVDTSRTLPNVMSVQTVELWDLMSAASDPIVNKRAADVQKAYDWIVENPDTHITKCRFEINSDWGEIGLLTPSAFIREDPATPPPTENTNFVTTKIAWGRGGQFGNVIIDFIIENDGSPVDIALSHGRDRSTSGDGQGQCSVIINGTKYNNPGGNDGPQWYYQCEVNPNAASLLVPA